MEKIIFMPKNKEELIQITDFIGKSNIETITIQEEDNETEPNLMKQIEIGLKEVKKIINGELPRITVKEMLDDQNTSDKPEPKDEHEYLKEIMLIQSKKLFENKWK
jgi:hypothetical protein